MPRRCSGVDDLHDAPTRWVAHANLQPALCARLPRLRRRTGCPHPECTPPGHHTGRPEPSFAGVDRRSLASLHRTAQIAARGSPKCIGRNVAGPRRPSCSHGSGCSSCGADAADQMAQPPSDVRGGVRRRQFMMGRGGAEFAPLDGSALPVGPGGPSTSAPATGAGRTPMLGGAAGGMAAADPGSFPDLPSLNLVRFPSKSVGFWTRGSWRVGSGRGKGRSAAGVGRGSCVRRRGATPGTAPA